MADHLAGLFDGHAGRAAAKYAAQNLPGTVAAALQANPDAYPLVWYGRDRTSISRSCLAHLTSSLRDAILETNNNFEKWWQAQKHAARAPGCTGLVVLIVKRVCYVANIGDSRAVLCRGGKAVRLSKDQKPYDDDEEARIRALGGYVVGEIGRVNGSLAISRAIGDFGTKSAVRSQVNR